MKLMSNGLKKSFKAVKYLKYKLLPISLSLIAFIGSANAQVDSSNNIFEYNDFSGGLNSKLNSLELPKKQGDIVENVRLDEELMSLTKRDQLIIYGEADENEPITGMHRLYLDDGTKVLIVTHGNEIEKATDSTKVFTQILPLTTSDKRWSWATWHNIAIGTDGSNQPVKYDGTSVSATFIGSLLATDKGSGTGPTGSDYKYKVLCYSSSYDATYNQVSNELDMTGNDLTLTMIPLCPDTILGEDTVGREVYRNKTAGSTYYLLSNGIIANNTAVTLTDSDTDAGLTATTYPAGDITYTPPNGKYLLIHKNRLWLANDPDYPSRIYYSEDGLPDTFLSTAYFNVRQSDGDGITFAMNLLGKLTLGKNNTIQKIYTDGDTPSADWAISDPFSFIGCQAPYSAVNTTIGIVYLGNNGIYSFNGQYSELLSDAVTPEIRDILPSNFANVWSAFFKSSYYMTYASLSSGEAVNNRVLILDLLSKGYMTDLINVNVFDVFDSGTDVEALYSGASDSGTVYAHTETVNQVIHKVHADFTGTFDDMRYIPTGIPGGDSESPVLELSHTGTIDEASGTIDAATGIIDRPDTDGTYISQYLTIGASVFEKLYWNEVIPTVGGNVTLNVRAGATTSDCAAATWWHTEFSDSSGSDISSVTADTVTQYRISMETDDITETPNVINQDNFNVRLTFNSVGTAAETSIPINWRSGWLNYGESTKAKTLKKLYAYYDWPDDTAGTLNLTFENYLGDTDTFAIDLLENPDYYINYFTDGAFTGNLIRLTINEDSLIPIKVKKVITTYDVQPQSYKFPN